MGNPRRIYTQEEKELILKEYVENKKSLHYCSKLVHSNSDTVKKFLIENGVKVRNRAEALANAGQKERKYPVNDNYFSESNEKMAYLIGFIAADGNVSKKYHNLTITLSEVDIDFLRQIKQELGGREVKTYQNQDGFSFCTWSCASRQIREDLEKYNIIPNKTFSFTFPESLPKIFWKDFIRGYFDGDGSIYEDANGLRFSIVSAEEDILEKINQYFFENCQTSKQNVYKNKKQSIEYVLRYRTQDAINIFNHIYYKDCFCLPRKFNKYKELIEKRKTSKRLHNL